MNIKKTLTTLLAGSMVVGLAMVTAAGPASAVDHGPVLPGDIYFLSAAGGFESNSAATVVTSGVAAVRPFQSLAVNATCPATAAQIQAFVRIPQAGVAENDWTQVAITAGSTLKDSLGRPYTARSDFIDKSEILDYLNNVATTTHTGQFPVVVSCLTAGGIGVGTFRTLMTVSGTSATDLTWSVTAAAYPGVATTTTVAASAATVESGSPVTLTSTVAPAAAEGDVEFFAGTTSLGTAALTAGSASLATSALPIGTSSITATYLGGTGYDPSTSAATSVEVTAVAARSTTTDLTVSPVSGDAYAPVTFTTTVVASAGAANGTVTFKDGSVTLGSLPVVDGACAPFTTNVLGAGSHSLVAEFTGTAPYTSSASAVVAATYVLAGAVDEQTVTVSIPAGTIAITTPYTPAAPLALGTAVLDPADSTYSASAAFNDIVITDTRAGNLGFNASVVSGAFINGAGESFGGIHAGLTDLSATQVAGNALLATDIVKTNHAPFVDGLDVPKVFATYPAGKSVGTAHLRGTFGIDQVPTSVKPGLYTATVTFTAV